MYNNRQGHYSFFPNVAYQGHDQFVVHRDSVCTDISNLTDTVRRISAHSVTSDNSAMSSNTTMWELEQKLRYVRDEVKYWQRVCKYSLIFAVLVMAGLGLLGYLEYVTVTYRVSYRIA